MPNYNWSILKNNNTATKYNNLVNDKYRELYEKDACINPTKTYENVITANREAHKLL